MEAYKKTIQRRIRFFTVCLLVQAVYMTTTLFELLPWQFQAVNETIGEFQGGLISGLMVLVAMLIFRYSRALKDDTKLKAMYNQEHDERMKVIRQKSGMPMLLFLSIAMILCGMVAGYYNMTVFYTLIYAGLAQLTIGVIVKLVYMKVL